MSPEKQYLGLLVESVVCLMVTGVLYSYREMFPGYKFVSNVVIFLTQAVFALGFTYAGLYVNRFLGVETYPINPQWASLLIGYAIGLLIPMTYCIYRIFKVGPWHFPGKIIIGFGLLPQTFWRIISKLTAFRLQKLSRRQKDSEVQLVRTVRYKPQRRWVRWTLVIILFAGAVFAGVVHYAISGFSGSPQDYALQLVFLPLASWVCSATLFFTWSQFYKA